MDASERTVRDLARAILDGTPVDWQAVESTADETERPIFEQLRLLATLVDFHREQRATTEPASAGDDVGPPPRPRAYWQRRIWTGVPRLGYASRSRSRAEAPPRRLGRRRRACVFDHRGRPPSGARAPSQRRHDLRRGTDRGHGRALDGTDRWRDGRAAAARESPLKPSRRN